MIICRRYQNLPKEEKEKQHQYGRKQYENLPAHGNQKLVE